ncbi:hypothetical protein LSAT2_011714 [Lamellibrachia satsuma]|nr:hypothetical protein LSAT2_011714 [Lamellibrachia satsuma]
MLSWLHKTPRSMEAHTYSVASWLVLFGCLLYSEQIHGTIAASTRSRHNVTHKNNTERKHAVDHTLLRHIRAGATTCSNIPCRNGETCINSGGGYQCLCRLQYAGRYCESCSELYDSKAIGMHIFKNGTLFNQTTCLAACLNIPQCTVAVIRNTVCFIQEFPDEGHSPSAGYFAMRAAVDPCCVTMPPYRYTACQLLELSSASRLNADAWTTAIELGIAAKLPTKRGCRGGVRKQRIIQPVIGHRPPTRQAITSKQTGVDSSNLVHQITPVSALDTCTAATLGLLNVRSLRNKADFITDNACENDIDILCLTETWLTDNDASLISAIVPHGYKFQHLPRNDRRGGGVGVLFKASFHLALSKPWPAESFECLEVLLRGSSVAAALRIFMVHRPPSFGRKSKPFRVFLEEFGELFERVSIKKLDLSYLVISTFTTEMVMTRTHVTWLQFSATLIYNNT